MSAEIKTGTYTGTGAALTVNLGWVPDWLQIINVTDGDITSIWADGMTDDTSFDIAAAAVTNAADGISGFDGVAGVSSPGFTVGTDLSESAKVYRYVAMRSGE